MNNTHPFDVSRFYSVMARHPNMYVGMWIKTWCILATSKRQWTHSDTLEGWSDILGENTEMTQRYIVYIQDHFSGIDVRVVKSPREPHVKYTITDEFHLGSMSKEDKKRIKAATFNRESKLTLSRNESRSKIEQAYHPMKAFADRTRVRWSFLELMREVSSGVHEQSKKIQLEKEEVRKILMYIAKFKTSPIWNKEGDMLKPLGEFIEAREWRGISKDRQDLRKSILNKMKERDRESKAYYHKRF